MADDIEMWRGDGMNDHEIADAVFWTVLAETGYDNPYMQLLLNAAVLVEEFEFDADEVQDALESVCSQMSIGPG